jgi:cell division protein FtsZ
LGKQTLHGSGSGGDPIVGRTSVEEASNDIRAVLENTDILFVVAGLGKGTGSGASPEIAKIAKELGILTVAIVNFPSVNAEGRNVYENALNSFDLLKNEVDSITKISNDKIIDNDRNISFVSAFEKANMEVTDVVSNIVDMISSASNMNLDFADVSNFFKAHKTFMSGSFTLTTPYSFDNLKEIVEQNIKASYSDVNVKTNNAKIVMNLKINTKIPSSVTNDIRNIFKEVTSDNALTLVHGVDYVNIEGLKASYLVSANDETTIVKEEASTVHFDEIVEKTSTVKIFKNEEYIDLDEYKTNNCKTGGVKRETIKFDTEEIILDSKQMSSQDINKLMTKAINGVINEHESSDYPKKYN